MPNVTRCPHCGKLFEAFSEEMANSPDYKDRLCPDCFDRLRRIKKLTNQEE